MTNNQRFGCQRRCPAPIRSNPLDNDERIPQAMAYVKNGGFGRIFEPYKALSEGTVFPELCKPFYGSAQRQQCARRNYR